MYGRSDRRPDGPIFFLKILPLCASSSLVGHPDISAIKNSLLRSSCSHTLYSVWSDPLDPIRYVCSDLTQSDIIFSILFGPLTMLFSDSISSSHSNPIQHSRSLFLALLSPLRSSEPLVLLTITYNKDPSNLIITYTTG